MNLRKRIKTLVIIMALYAPLLSFSQDQNSKDSFLSLAELETAMLDKSLDLRSVAIEVEAAKEKRYALPSIHVPKLTLDGNYKYLSEIPEINMAPGRTLKFGDNKNYSIGPTVSMTLLDFNAKSHQQASLDKKVSSKENEAESLKANLLFKTRYHYLNLVFLVEKRNLISESLKVARKQLKDVSAQKRFGAGSKLDLLTAQKEVHELESQHKEIIINIMAEQTELFKLTFHPKIKEVSFIEDTGQLQKLPELQHRFFKYHKTKLDPQANSKIKSIRDQSESLESQAKSIISQRYPKINLFARTSLEYPNGPDHTQFNQNSFGVSISMPLFDGGEISHNIREKSLQAMALKQQALNEERNLDESIQLTIKRIESLIGQSEIIQKKVDESSEIARLIYKSYQEGRATFLEVERANIKSRESKLSLSSNHYQITLNLIQLANVAGE